MVRGLLTVGGWTMASRVLGFARDMLIAAVLGAGPIADAFFVALKLPNLFRRLFGEGAFSAAFVPEFAGRLATDGKAAAREFAEQAAAIMLAWLAALTALGLLLMPWIMLALAPGFADEPLRYGLAVELTRLTFPYLLLICLTALLSGVLNAMDRFSAAAAAPILFNLSGIVALAFFPTALATPAHGLALAVTISGALQLALTWWAARTAGMTLLPRLPRITPGVRLLLRRMGPGVLGAGVTQLNLAIDVIIASLLPVGAVSYLYFADRVAQLPLGVVGAALGTALLPLLSRQVRTGAHEAAGNTLNRGIEIGLVLALPAALALAVLALPIITVLFGRGAFGPAEAAATAAALVAYAVGLPAYILVKVFAPGFFARGDTGTPVRVGIAAVALNLVLNLVLMGPLAHVGIALSTALAAVFNAAALAWLLHRRGHWDPDARLLARLPRIVAAAVAITAVLLVSERGLAAATAFGAPGWLALGAVVGLVLVAYGGILQATGAVDLRELRGMLRRRPA